MRVGAATLGAVGLLTALVGCKEETSPAQPSPAPTQAPAAVETATEKAAPTDPHAEAKEKIRRFVERLYDTKTGNDYNSNPGGTFEPELAQALQTQRRTGMETGIWSDAFGYDPFCNCQDSVDLNHAISAIEVSGDRAKVTFTLTNFGQTEARSMQLIDTPAGWRVYDIDGKYRALVFGG